MPNRETRRANAKAAKKSGVENVISIKCKGVTYRIDFDSFSALDEFHFYKATGGISFTEIFASENPPLFALAGILWLHRRHKEPDLSFEDVAGDVTFSDFEDVDQADAADDEAKGSDPEA